MKKLKFLIVLAVLLGNCSKQIQKGPALGYSFMPRYLDTDSIGVKIPKNVDEVVDSSLEDYKSIPVLGGTIYNGTDSIKAPMGVLFSEKKTAQYIYFESEYNRLKVELKYLKYLNQEYYDKSLSAEKLYQDEINRLKEKSKRSWLEKNGPYIGFAAGILSAVLTELMVIKIAD